MNRKSLRKTIECLILLTGFFGLAPTPGLAQAPLAIGDRVRVTTDAASYVGEIRSVAPDRLTVHDDEGGELFVGPLDSVESLEVARGQRALTGVGLAGGAALGLMSGFVICSLGEVCSILSSNDIRPEVVLTSAAVGLLVGGLVGSRIRRDRWVEVTAEHLRIAFRPSEPGSVSPGFVLGIQARLGGEP